jgi:DMSO/TMAO reductase YedYZ heme-binding membrane subunit
MTPTSWYVARSAGIVAYLLLSTSVVVGTLLVGRRDLRWPKFAVQEIHRYLSILTGVFVVLHGGALLLDRVVPFSLTQALVPFSTSYRPFAVGLGVAAAELMAAIGITNHYRKRLPYMLWRRVHYLTLVVWLGASAHGVLAGTDRQDAWFLALVTLAACAVTLAFLVRISGRAELPAIASVAVATGAAMLALAFTPEPPAPSARTAAAAAQAVVPASYSSSLSGRVVAQDDDPLVSVVGNAGSAAVRVDLLVEGGVVDRSSLQLRFPSGATCEGSVTSLESSGLAGSCGGHTVRIAWQIAEDRSVSGRLTLA